MTISSVQRLSSCSASTAKLALRSGNAKIRPISSQRNGIVFSNLTFGSNSVLMPFSSCLLQSCQTGVNHVSFSTSAANKSSSTSSNSAPLFKKILIANRGEIACRVMRTAKKMGIQTVAVFSEPDRNSEHVKMADEAFCIGPAASSESYLNMGKILEVIKETKSEAVHPGYGFLSENHLFAEELEKIGVAFIGPGSKAITAMGDKIESKQLAAKAGVNTIPGNLRVMKDADDAVKTANEVGYPVMIKASAGGGGKGMRIAYNDKEVRTGFRLSKDEAKKSFGDDRMFVEKYIEEPRHIEIQLIGDAHGNVCGLPERECSIQRRNQKVLEEAPSVLLDEKTRRAMQAQAVQLAKAVEYKSAGTVEFLCDKNRNFYFLEMNTRLQVEHPVTELVSGVDLVELMIRVAAGEKLPEEMWKGYIDFKGHAHEARVYAEDPVRGFLPSIGRLLRYEEPRDIPNVRIDSGVTQGSEISMFYDPMIAKLCTYGETREEALKTLETALDSYVIQGVGHNAAFLRDVCRNERFRVGKITTKFIPEEYPDGFKGVNLTNQETVNLAAIVSMIYAQYFEETTKILSQKYQRELPNEIYIEINKEMYEVSLNEQVEDEGLETSDNEEDAGDVMTHKIKSLKTNEVHNVSLTDFDWSLDQILCKAEIADEPHVVQVVEKDVCGFKVQYCGAVLDAKVYLPHEFKYKKFMLEKVEPDHSKFLLSPMPGQLVSLAVQEGQEVFVGQELCVVEAMKMQNVLVAEKTGKIKKIEKQAGMSVQVDELIMSFE